MAWGLLLPWLWCRSVPGPESPQQGWFPAPYSSLWPWAMGLAKPGPPMCPHPSPASACLQSPAWPSQGCVWPCFPSPGLTLIPTHGLMSWPGLGLVRFQHRYLMPWGGGCLVQCPSSERGQLWQGAQHQIQTRFEYLLVWRLHNRFGQLF